MLTEDELASMRETVSSALPDTATVTRVATGRTFNATTGAYTAGTVETVWSGNCRVRPQQAAERQTIIGDAHATLHRYIGTVDFDADGLAVDDFLTVDTSTDDHMVGRWFRILEIRDGSWNLGRRLLLEDVTRSANGGS